MDLEPGPPQSLSLNSTLVRQRSRDRSFNANVVGSSIILSLKGCPAINLQILWSYNILLLIFIIVILLLLPSPSPQDSSYNIILVYYTIKYIVDQIRVGRLEFSHFPGKIGIAAGIIIFQNNSIGMVLNLHIDAPLHIPCMFSSQLAWCYLFFAYQLTFVKRFTSAIIIHTFITHITTLICHYFIIPKDSIIFCAIGK